MQNNGNNEKSKKGENEKQEQQTKQAEQAKQTKNGQTEQTEKIQTKQKEKQEKEKQQEEKQQKQQTKQEKDEAQETKQTAIAWHEHLLQPVEFDMPLQFQVKQSQPLTQTQTTRTITTEKQKLEEKTSDIVGWSNEEEKQEKEIKYKATPMYEAKQFYEAGQKFYAEEQHTEQINFVKVEDLANLSDIERKVIKTEKRQFFAPELNMQQAIQDEQMRQSQTQQFQPAKFELLTLDKFKDYVGRADIKKKIIKFYE